MIFNQKTYMLVFRGVTALLLLLNSFEFNAQSFNMSNSLGTVTNACGGTFYDSGGPFGNYSNFESSIATFCAPPGQFITFTFTQFDLEFLFDDLIIYNGPNTAAPIIGIFTGTNSPGTITSSLGGCITFNFFSDGSITGAGWSANITCSSAPPSTGNSCTAANPFCTGTIYNFPNNTGVPNLGQINCLLTTPNPVWYYFQIENPGNLTINISQQTNGGIPIDVDFNLWGPFNSLSEGCAAISTGSAPNVDCSYDPAATEQANLFGAQTGEFYILLLTNFSNLPGNITFTNTPSSTATTNCQILCSITDLTATPTACSPSTNTYTLNGQVSVFDPPTTGTLTIISSCGGSVVLNPPFANTINYSIPGIVPTGASCNVTASFSADATCSFTQAYTSPAPCVSPTLNCPQYANTSNSPNETCGGQIYYLEVPNTGCNGTITFNVIGNWGSSWAEEISWTVTSIQTGTVLASGIGNVGLNGQNFNVTVGPLNPSAVGNVFRLTVFDSFGDGFNGFGGFITVQQPVGTNIITPISGDFGLEAFSLFTANIAISPATITVNTPTGTVTNSVNNCKDFKVPITLQNNNYCSTQNVNLPWSIVCQSTGSLISSGSTNIVVFPAIPENLSDVVNIEFNEDNCNWEVTPLAGCTVSDIGSVFTISPDPATASPSAVCEGGFENFQLNYIGLASGPNCCSTGGPLVPIEYVQTFAGADVSASISPFWSNSNHAALITIPANGLGGDATSLNLSVSVNNYCFNPPSIETQTTYFIFIFVDGQQVFVQATSNPAPVNNSISVNLSNIAQGYNENSTISIYVIPNVFALDGVNTIFNPNLSCPIALDGRWRANISASIDVSFAEQGPTAASCAYQAAPSYTCCIPSIVNDASATICSGGSLSALNTWTNAVAASNSSCVVFSSVTPIAGSVAPDNQFPNGINNGLVPVTQSVSAYTYCDIDGSGTVNAGDTYTLISTFTLTINPLPNAGIGSDISICGSGNEINLFSLLGGSPQSGGTWTGPSTLSNGSLGTFTPGSNPSGIYTYTITGISPCGNASANVEVQVNDNTEAQINYPGPYCIDISTPQQPIINGAGGGTFSATPAGLSLNTLTGAVIPSLSSPGTYTVTYSIPAAGSCPAFSTTETVVITAIPANPTLSPDPACAGTSTLFTAGNGVLYEFYLNGTAQGDVSATNTFNSPVLTAGDEICVRSFPPVPFIINGIINEPQWGAPLAKSTGGPVSGFGPNNNLDAVYFKNMNGILYGAVAGRVENNSNNRILIFIDSKPGGFNNLGGWVNRSQAPYVTIENLNGGINFDPGFEPDYILAMNEANNEAFFDLYDMQNNTNNYLGSNISNLNLAYLPNSGQFDNGQGFEFAFPLSLIGNPNVSFKAFAMIVNDPGLGNPAATFLSNQFLTRANFGENNYGDGAVFFGSAAPDPINFNLSADCFSETCIIVQPSFAPVTGFTLPDSICHDDPSINPSVVSGFTSGGNFSALPTGLSLNPSTGEINTAASTPGTYNITYTVPANGCNPAGTTTISITINPAPTTTTIYHD